MSTPSMNTQVRPQDSLSSHPFLIQVSDTITTSNLTIHIRVIPNTNQSLEPQVLVEV